MMPHRIHMVHGRLDSSAERDSVLTQRRVTPQAITGMLVNATTHGIGGPIPAAGDPSFRVIFELGPLPPKGHHSLILIFDGSIWRSRMSASVPDSNVAEPPDEGQSRQAREAM